MRWLFRGVLRPVLMLTLIGFVLGNLSTGGFRAITSAVGYAVTAASETLGLDETASSVGDATGGQQKKAVKSKAVVVDSIDGDTFEVELKSGKEIAVRILGVDSPESRRPGVPIEECALEAAAAGKALSESRAVKLTTDPTQDTVDQYGRWLYYAEIGGKDYGLSMLKKGWVAPYVYKNNPVQKIDAYRKAAAFAESRGRGVWGKCAGGLPLRSRRAVLG